MTKLAPERESQARSCQSEPNTSSKANCGEQTNSSPKKTPSRRESSSAPRVNFPAREPELMAELEDYLQTISGQEDPSQVWPLIFPSANSAAADSPVKSEPPESPLGSLQNAHEARVSDEEESIHPPLKTSPPASPGEMNFPLKSPAKEASEACQPAECSLNASSVDDSEQQSSVKIKLSPMQTHSDKTAPEGKQVNAQEEHADKDIQSEPACQKPPFPLFASGEFKRELKRPPPLKLSMDKPAKKDRRSKANDPIATALPDESAKGASDLPAPTSNSENSMTKLGEPVTNNVDKMARKEAELMPGKSESISKQSELLTKESEQKSKDSSSILEIPDRQTKEGEPAAKQGENGDKPVLKLALKANQSEEEGAKKVPPLRLPSISKWSSSKKSERRHSKKRKSKDSEEGKGERRKHSRHGEEV